MDEHNKRIAKNTILLYIRMFISVIVGLYTSRVVLNTLGASDYGVYNVVGGIVAMFSFLNTSMSGATSRFLTYEMGKENDVRLAQTFSSAMIIHIAIALVVFILAETIGLWFLINKLVIPEGRMTAAHIVYQLSVLSMMVTITQVPYNASIIAHEKMDIYAYVELLNVFLKLGIVYLLLIGHFDKLILYASLVFAVSLLIATIYRVYCIRHFKECHIKRKLHKDIIKPMLSFSVWDLYGNMSVSFRSQGTTFLLNMFFGTLLNAANGIATNVHGIILGFANNVIMAFRPQIIKEYAANNLQRMSYLIENALKFTLALYLLIAIPLFAEADYVLKLWLKNVPDYTAFFLRIVMFCGFFSLSNDIINIIIHATGKIKALSFLSGSIYLLNLPLMYFILKQGGSVYFAYTTLLYIAITTVIVGIGIAKTLVPQLQIRKVVLKGFLLNFILIIVVAYPTFILTSCMPEGFGRLILSVSLSVLITSTYMFFIMLNDSQRHSVVSKIKKHSPLRNNNG